MKIKNGFELQDICGYNIIVAEGVENIDFNNIFTLNETATFLWKNVQGKDFTTEDLANMLTQEYDVNHDTALADCGDIVNQWKEAGIVE